jgi:hypothetical protein
VSETLGSLVIDIAAELAGFKKGLSDAEFRAEQMARNIEKSVERVSSAFESMTDRITEIGAVVGVAFSVDRVVEFTKSVIESAAHVHELSQAVGISAKSLTAYSVAAAETGVDIEELATGMGHLEKQANAAAHGNESAAAAFAAIGVKVTDASGRIKNADQLFRDTTASIASYANGVGKAAVEQELLGRGGARMTAFLNELGANFEEATAKAERFGLLLSDADASAFNKLETTFTDIGLVIKGQFSQALLSVLPQLQAAADKILSFVENSTFLKTVVTDGAAALAFLADHLDAVATVLKDIAVIAAAQAFLSMAEGAYKLAGNLVLAGNAAVTLKGAVGAIPAAIAAWDIGTSIGNWLNSFQVVRNGAVQLIAALDGGWSILKAGFELVSAGIEAAWNAMLQGIKSSFAAFLDVVAKASFGQASAQVAAYAASLRAGDPEAKTFAQRQKEIGDELAKNIKIDRQIINDMVGYVDVVVPAAKATNDHADAAAHAGKSLDGFNASAKSAAERLQNATDSVNKFLASLEAIGQGTLDKAWSQYVARLQQIQIELHKLQQANASAGEQQAFVTEAVNANREAYDREYKSIVATLDVHDQLEKKYREQAYLLGLSEEARKVETIAIQEEDVALKALQKALGDPQAKLSAEVVAGIHSQVQAWVALDTAIKNDVAVAKDWQSITSNAFSSAFQEINKDIVEGGDVMKGLVNVAKQTVEAIIFEFEKLAIINPVLNSIFGGSAGGSILPTLANSAFGGGGGGGAGFFGALAGGAGGGGGGAGAFNMGGPSGVGSAVGGSGSAAGGFSLFSPSSWLGAGQNLGQGVTNAFSSFWNGSGGAGYSGSFNMGGPSGVGYNGSYGGYGSGVGQAIGVAGAIYAGYNEFHAAGGGTAGAVGGATYAAGTYALGAGLTSAAAGTGFAAGVSGAFAAIPVVGWIALAAMVINMISGGKLFGTAWKATGSEETFKTGPAGSSVTAVIDEKRQGALFSGSEYKQVGTKVDQQTQDAFSAFFTQEQNTVARAAQILGTEAGILVSGSFTEVFDKHGKLKTQLSTVLGKTYSESITDFETRITADNLIALLPAAQAAQSIATKWQASAQSLMDGAQFLVAAQADINRGHSLLGSDTSLADIDAITEKLVQGSEHLIDTYSRLTVEQADVKAFFDMIGVQAGKTGADFVQLADDMATAAGGVQNLDKLQQAFFKEFYSPAEQASASLGALKKNQEDMLSAIGETPGESLGQFKTDFLAKLPTLTGEQITQWYQAADALYQYTTAVTDSATSIADAKQKYGEFEIQLSGDSFLASFEKITAAEKSQIDQANALAIAAGNAGASQQDLADIVTASSLQMGQALAQLSDSIYQDIQAVYGPPASMDPNNPAAFAFGQQAAQAAQAQQAARTTSAAYDLIRKLGDYEFVSGKTTADVLKAFGLTPEQLAQTLGVSPDVINKDIEAAANQAAGLLKLAAASEAQSGILADILAAIQGKPLPFDLSSLIGINGSKLSLAPGGDVPIKGGGGHIVPGPTAKSDLVNHADTVHKSSSSMAKALDRNTAALNAHAATLERRNTAPAPRNSRATGFAWAQP